MDRGDSAESRGLVCSTSSLSGDFPRTTGFSPTLRHSSAAQIPCCVSSAPKSARELISRFQYSATFTFIIILYRSKAVSDGAVSFYIDHFVRARIAKATYGAICSARYNSTNKEHTKRLATTFMAPSGERRVPEMFCVIIAKVRPSPSYAIGQ